MMLEMVCGVRWCTVFLNKAHVSCNLTDVEGGVGMRFMYRCKFMVSEKNGSSDLCCTDNTGSASEMGDF